MSWIYAFIGSGHDEEFTPAGFLGTPLCVMKSPGLYIALGGISDTCRYGGDGKKGWAMVGLGIEVGESQSRLLETQDWQSVLSRDTPWQEWLNGHFVALRWNGEHVECFTDELGQRTAYFSICDRGLCISTRLDWVARTTGHSDVDFASLGAKWLMFNQLEYSSCVVGIDRLGPRGHAVFRKGRPIINQSTPWTPEFGNATPERAVSILSSLLRGARNRTTTVSLGLSGGLDSRLLLAMLVGLKDSTFVVHTFGDPMDPDVRVSSAISKALGLDQQLFHEPLPDIASSISMLREFAAQSCLGEPASSFVKLRYYPALRQQGRLLIDGGFGEIARRQYLNRIARLGRSALRRRDPSALFPLMRVHRGDIFQPDVVAAMERGALESLGRTLSSLPPANEIGVENTVDLLAIRTRVPNWGAPEQARLDADVINFMPLVQPSFLRAIFAAKSQLRSDRFYRKVIRACCPSLADFPLVKGGTTYGFDLPTSTAWLLTKVKARLGRGFDDSSPDLLLVHMKEHVLDNVHSSGPGLSASYDIKKVRHAVNTYYSTGDRSARRTVDWWLTYDVWKRSLSNKGE